MIQLIEKLPVSDKVLLAASIVVIALMAAFIVVGKRRKKQKQKIETAFIKQKRDEHLMKLLGNGDRDDDVVECQPYEVLYEKTESSWGDDEDGADSLRIQLIVKSPLSTKKFISEVKERFFIGRKKSNNLVLDNKNVSARHCALLNLGGRLYAYDLNSTNGTVLSRKQSREELGRNPVRVMHGDRLLIAGMSVTINFVDD